jgi:hypothetical protein
VRGQPDRLVTEQSNLGRRGVQGEHIISFDPRIREAAKYESSSKTYKHETDSEAKARRDKIRREKRLKQRAKIGEGFSFTHPKWGEMEGKKVDDKIVVMHEGKLKKLHAPWVEGLPNYRRT